MFGAVFAMKRRGKVCTDNAAEENIMDTRTLREMEETGADITVQELNCPRVFKMSTTLANGEHACLTCKSMVSVDTELKIRHGAALGLRNIN